MKKTKLFFICLSLLVCVCMARTNKPKVNRAPTSYKVTNWSQYKAPEEIKTETLKKLLGDLGRYQKLEYCPFGSIEECKRPTVEAIVTKIIKDVLDKEAAEEEIDLPPSTTIKPSVKTKGKSLREAIKINKIESSKTVTNKRNAKKAANKVKVNLAKNYISDLSKKNVGHADNKKQKAYEDLMTAFLERYAK